MIPSMMTTFEKGEQLGFQLGLQQGKRHILRLQLEKKFGPLSDEVLHRLDGMPAERLND